MPIEFMLFAAVLVGIAVWHRGALAFAVAGLSLIVAYKLAVTGFHDGPGLLGLARHWAGHWVALANLLALLLGFAVLADQLEISGLPGALPERLPSGWPGALVLLVTVFVLSGMIDNIAAALIGGTVANSLYGGRLHVGYVAAIVAASNAGGAGSVVGDTTTTMMWIAGVSPVSVLEAYVGAGVALLVCGVPAALQQSAFAGVHRPAGAAHMIDWGRVAVVIVVLAAAIAVNVSANVTAPRLPDAVPVLGLGVWVALLLTAPMRPPRWHVLASALPGAVFLLALVAAASLMPVERLPPASWQTAFGLGIVSAVLDNIPLTALAIEQGGYDWGFLAYAVGFGGSMLWFGSSAGVAIAGLAPQARSATQWLKAGWHVPLAYVAGFAVMLVVLGWHPDPPLRH